MRAPLLALLTDFGLQDPYVGALKSVVLGRIPDLPIVDLSHAVPPQDVRWGAFLLRGALAYLPPRSVVLAVVDPGVGSSRRLLCASAGELLLLAPDNGLLTAALAGRGGVRWFALDPARGFGLPRPSATFHGRDLLAPAAASLAAGSCPERWGTEIGDPVHLSEPERERGPERWSGRIAVVDHYGNLISDLEPPDEGWLAADRVLELPGRWAGPLVRTYADTSRGEVLAYVGSYGTFEIAVRDGSAAERFQLGAGSPVVLRRRGV